MHEKVLSGAWHTVSAQKVLAAIIVNGIHSIAIVVII